METRYAFKEIEAKWRPYWEKIDLYKTGTDPDKPNIYILDYFPYPSGAGLSVGHCRNYVPTGIAARTHRMQGYNVLHPMGWDAFGMPAENYAIEHGIHPRESSQLFASTYKRQMQLLACSYDWSREINSTDPDYYRWTQYFFNLLFERGLAYQAIGSQWWCPHCQTILANEQVENGCCWRCDTIVEKKDLQQWYFKITDYADRLIDDLDKVTWPENIKTMQRNWIGRSEGADIFFKTEDGAVIETFTTRPDTLYGVTFIAIAPEHPLVEKIVTAEQATAVTKYITTARRLTDIERQAVDKAKTGVFSGSYAYHPLTRAPIPIWIADYVLPSYGSGAVMGVPGHDSRDFAFAQTYDLPVKEVVSPDGRPQGVDTCFADDGILLNSDRFSGMTSAAAIEAITETLIAAGAGRKQVTTKLRDWLISRQRYWGAPIPIIHCPQCGPVAVPTEDLPVELPDTHDFAPAGDGRSPLARIESWVNITCPACGTAAKRETDTMDGFACSSWYFLRFASPHEAERPFDPQAVEKWLPVDIYVGGAEHAVMHLLYARFWTKVMFDAGLVSFVEPFTELRNQGMMLSAVDGQKMSKSKGNVVTPDEVAAEVGTDALRLYIVFLGPLEAEITWDDSGIRGISRFLDRFWRLATAIPPAEIAAFNQDFERQRHKTIKRVTEDMDRFRYNTAVAALMEYLNYLGGQPAASVDQWRTAVETFTLMLAPFAPFICEEVWQVQLGHGESVHRQPWPAYKAALTIDEQVTLVVQVNGKLRDKVVVALNEDEAVIREKAVAAENVQRHLSGKPIRKMIVVPNKLVNIVV